MNEYKNDEKGGRGKKEYSFVKQRARREKRRQEAVARNKNWAVLSKEQKAASLKNRRGESKKQLSRILGK